MMMMQQYFPNNSCADVPYLKRCEYKNSQHVVVDEVIKSESSEGINSESPDGSTFDVDDDERRRTSVVSLDPENVKEYGGFVDHGQKVNVISLLSNPKSGRDFLVNSSGEQIKVSSIIGKYILIYCFEIPVDSYSTDGVVCWALKRAIPHWPNFQLVVVTKMDNNTKINKRQAFNTFVSAFPNCLSVPMSDSDSYDRVFGFFESNQALLLDPDGIILHLDIDCDFVFRYGSASFPFTFDHLNSLDKIVRNWLNRRPVPLENLLGLGLSDILYNAAGNTIAVSDLKQKLVGLYLYKSGVHMDAINQAYQYCQANNLELDIVLVYLPVSDDPLHFITGTHAALKDKGISSWWLLPFDDSTSRRLWQLCECSIKDQLIIVGPQGEFLDSFAANIVTDSRSGVIKDMYPYAAEAVARQETERLKKLTLASLFSSPQHKRPLLTQKVRRVSLKKLRGKIVCLFIANCDSYVTLETIRSWCHENKGHKDTNVALVLIPLHSSKLKFTPNSSPKLSWLWGPAMPWLICPPDPVVEASIIKHTTLRGLTGYNLSYLTFGEDGKLLSVACPDLSEIQANSFPAYELYELILEKYTDRFEYERDHYDCY